MGTDNEEISDIYHKAPGPEPSASLDNAILAASRDAVEQPARAKGPFSGGWRAATAIAAVIVITVILVPALRHEEEQTQPGTIQQESRPAEQLDEAVPGVHQKTDLKKKSVNLTRPASESLVLPDKAFTTRDRAGPQAGSTGSPASIESSADDLHYPEKEELAAPPAAAERSRMEAADSAPFAIHTPEMWEAKINQLIEAGDYEAARAELEQLGEHYPDYAINSTLFEKLE
ncbi:MAG: hypothetical protein JSW45_03195 [Thiotrichales bacterium]|nr:MAG: hypothetical protein JSW45_03195 [Thiotrichales bacterium]